MTPPTLNQNHPKPETPLSQISSEQARAVFEQCGIVPHLWDSQGFVEPNQVTITLLESGYGGDTPQGNTFSYLRHDKIMVVSSGTLSDRVASNVEHRVFFSSDSTVGNLTACLINYANGQTPFSTERMKARYDPTVERTARSEMLREGSDPFNTISIGNRRFW